MVRNSQRAKVHKLTKADKVWKYEKMKAIPYFSKSLINLNPVDLHWSSCENFWNWSFGRCISKNFCKFDFNFQIFTSGIFSSCLTENCSGQKQKKYHWLGVNKFQGKEIYRKFLAIHMRI